MKIINKDFKKGALRLVGNQKQGYQWNSTNADLIGGRWEYFVSVHSGKYHSRQEALKNKPKR